MKLSEAIRLGAMTKPQSFRGWMDGVGTCALGAASEALGFPPLTDWMDRPYVNYNALREAFPLLSGPCSCPMGGRACYGVFRIKIFMEVIWHLNDEHRWTRERIADFVELHEPMPEPASVEEHAEAAK